VTSPVIIALAIILVIFTVVVIHESGHYFLAKLFGIRVDEFAVGFGPKLASRKRGETEYSLRVLPLGGYVRMAGMLGLPGESDAGPRNFYRATIPKRFATIAAGIIFNFIFAGLCFTVVNVASSGRPWAEIPGAPAAAAGIPNGSAITAVDGKPIRDDTLQNVSDDLHAATAASQGRPMNVTYRAPDGAVRTTVVKPELVILNPTKGSLPVGQLVITAINHQPVGTGDPAQILASASVTGYVPKSDGSIGQRFTDAQAPPVVDGFAGTVDKAGAAWLLGVQAGVPGQSLPAAFVSGFGQIPSFIHDTAVGIYQLITVPKLGGVNGPNGLSGPVGIAQATATASQNGFLSQNGLVFWIGFISMNLGLINVLPIPFLDGGKLFFLGIEAIRRKRLEPRNEAIISAVGLALVVMLLIYVTIGDVSRLTGAQ